MHLHIEYDMYERELENHVQVHFWKLIKYGGDGMIYFAVDEVLEKQLIGLKQSDYQNYSKNITHSIYLDYYRNYTIFHKYNPFMRFTI